MSGARSAGDDGVNILFLTTVLPGGRLGGGEIWSQNIIDTLRETCAALTVLGYDRLGEGARPGEIAVARRTVETSKAPLTALAWGIAAIAGSQPYTVQKWRGASYRDAVRALVAQRRWDLAILNHAGSAWLLDEIAGIPFVHLSHQAESALYAQHAAASGWTRPIHVREARLLATTEAALARRAVEVWTLGEEDSDYFRGLGARAVRTLPPTGRLDWDEHAPVASEPGSPVVGILGSWTWKPNADGLRWWLRDVLPHLPPEWRVEVGGKHRPKAFARPENVQFTGVAPDARDFLRRAQRLAVPSMSSVGVPIKLLDAIASGRPVVTTRVAAARIGSLPPHVVAVETGRQFADALIALQLDHNPGGPLWAATRRALLRESLREAVESLLT